MTSVFAIEFDHSAHEGLLAPEIADQATQMVPTVFIIIIGTVFLNGLSARSLALSLGVAPPATDGILFAGADLWIREIASSLQKDGHPVMLLDTRYGNIAAARMAGLHAIRANILSEHAEENLEFPGVTHLVAGTSNDEINSLATHEYAHIFGKANVWQIPPSDKDHHPTTSVAAIAGAEFVLVENPHFRCLRIWPPVMGES